MAWVLPSLLFVVTFAFYFVTIAPSVGLEDSGGFLITACHAGLSHPPGYPLWNLLVFSSIQLLPWMDCADKVHTIQALLGAMTISVLYLWLLKQLTSQFKQGIAFLTCLIIAVSPSFAFQARVAEVYILHNLLTISLFYCVSNFINEGTISEKVQKMSALLVGLLLANHWPLAVFSIASVLVWNFKDIRETLTRRKKENQSAFQLLLFFCMGLTPYLYLFVAHHFSGFYFYSPITIVSDWLDYILRKEQMGKDVLPSWHFSDSIGFILHFPSRFQAEFGTFFLLLFSFSFLNSASKFFASILLPIALPFLWRTEPSQFTYEMISFWEIQSFLLAVVISILFLEKISQTIKQRLVVISKFPYLNQIPYALLFITSLVLIFTNVQHTQSLREDLFPKRYAQLVLESLPLNAVLFTHSDTESGSIGYLHYAENMRPDLQVISQVSALFPNRVFPRKGFEVNEKRHMPILNRISMEMQRGHRVFTTRRLEAFDDKKSPFPLEYINYGIYFEIRDKAVQTVPNEPLPLHVIADIEDILQKEVSHSAELNYLPDGSSWHRYRNFLRRDLCHALFIHGIDLSSHPILSIAPECKFMQAQITHVARKDFEKADEQFREAIPMLTYLYRSELNERYRDFILNRLAWVNTVSIQDGQALLQQTIDLSSPIALSYPFCSNRNLPLLIEIASIIKDSKWNSQLLKAKQDCH